MRSLLKQLGIRLPIFQAPMAGVSTPAMAAAVSSAGGLGAIAVGASNPATARQMIRDVRTLTDRPINVNVFCHQRAVRDQAREAGWLKTLAPHFARFGASPPNELSEIYQTFLDDAAMLDVLRGERPAVVSFHFGTPSREQIASLHSAGIVLLATATSLTEAQAIAAAGIDGIVAQGFEAGGHRGMFDPAAHDDCLGTLALTRVLARSLDLPVIAAGGIMDGAGIAASLKLGATAAQLGTAFIGCAESQADAGYREKLFSPAAAHTLMTRAISGRTARCLPNRFTELEAGVTKDAIPEYPVAYSAGKALHTAAKAAGEFGYGAQWAGQAARLARQFPAATLVQTLESELEQALR